MGCEGFANVCKNTVVVDSGIEGATKYVHANRKGIDIIHAEVVGCEFSEDKAAKCERNDRNANPRCRSEEPDEEDEDADTKTEEGWNVDFGEHVILLTMQTFL